LAPLSSSFNFVPEKFKGYLAIQYDTFLLRKYYPFLVTKTGDRWALRRLALKTNLPFLSCLPDWGRGRTAVPLFSTLLCSEAPSIEYINNKIALHFFLRASLLNAQQSPVLVTRNG
jgi:hypothetical protein